VQAAQLAPLVYGVALVLVMLLAPGGFMGLVRRLAGPRRALVEPLMET
jgi:branched-chain amino acid transport system permease protein